jgi:hypothetical protein
VKTAGSLLSLGRLLLFMGSVWAPAPAGADAVYDAVNSIDGRYSVFAVKPSQARPHASEEAAAVAAACNVLKSVFPGRSVQPSSTSLTFAASTLRENGLAMKLTPSSSTPRWAMISAV